MQTKTIITKRPRCKTCGKLMDEWFMFQEVAEHPECAGERIANALIERIKKDFEKIKVK